MAENSSRHFQQASVVPFRIRDGVTEVLLITSRKRKDWILPKGIVEPGQTPQEAAAMEALEEAGVAQPVVRLTQARRRAGEAGVGRVIAEVAVADADRETAASALRDLAEGTGDEGAAEAGGDSDAGRGGRELPPPEARGAGRTLWVATRVVSEDVVP